MLFRHRGIATAAVAILVLGVALLAFACRTSAPKPTATPSPTATTTAAPGFPAQNLREVDWTSAAVLDEIRRHFNGGEVEPKRVAYVDLTADGREEALVVVESGGTAGDLGAAVYRLEGGLVSVLAWIDRPGQIELRLPNAGPTSPLILVKQGIFAPGDANCCPSRIRETTLRWDGVTFAILGEQTLPASP